MYRPEENARSLTLPASILVLGQDLPLNVSGISVRITFPTSKRLRFASLCYCLVLWLQTSAAMSIFYVGAGN